MRNTKHESFKIYDFRQEYKDSRDEISHIIVTDLAVEEVISKLAEAGIDINDLKPFIMLPLDYQNIFDESFRNNKKYEQREMIYHDKYPHEDGVLEMYHRESALGIDYIEEIFQHKLHKKEEELKRLEKAMEQLTDIQRRRIKLHYYKQLNISQIAERENRSGKAIRDSIRLALKKYKSFFKNTLPKHLKN